MGNLAHTVKALADSATTVESPAGIVCWLIEIVLINAWIPMDLWLGRTHQEYMTTEFKEGLAHPFYGAIIVFLLFGSIAAFIWHMFTARQGIS
jgi:hypothetical protein